MKNFFAIYLSQMLFAATNLFKYRKELKVCLLYNKLYQAASNIDFSVNEVTLLDLDQLKQANMQALILDFDGVLGNYGDLQPLPEVLEWLRLAIEIFGPGNIFILSNNPIIERKCFFEIYFNQQINFIISKPKPYPDGIIGIYDELRSKNGRSIDKKNILLVDDRLGTGILAAKIAGVASCLILNPYLNFRKHLLIEILFMVIRKLERILICRLL